MRKLKHTDAIFLPPVRVRAAVPGSGERTYFATLELACINLSVRAGFTGIGYLTFDEWQHCSCTAHQSTIWPRPDK